MTSVGITELKAHLGTYLRRTQAGERFHITFRGKEVADLVPPDPVRVALWQMVEAGEAEWSGESPTLLDHFYPNPGRPVSDLVDEDRGPRMPDIEPDPS